MEKDFSNLINEIRKCNICEDKFGFKPHPVVIGSATSKIVQISQAPSKMVDTILKPFTDQSGKKLKYEWYQITDEEFYNPDNFFITALAHCYPGKDKNGCDKAPPKICYEKWIKKELEYIDNKLYIIIGAKAAKIFFPDEDYNDLIFKNNILFNFLMCLQLFYAFLSNKYAFCCLYVICNVYICRRNKNIIICVE